ncbi:hypothetical protein JAAARDRAFT_73684 [Jaapia argillacea MUCL 33604]|uniref:Ras-domain-containing protein n=1 Tax=Jaapia argillacea MUCL 33604 TaxID=933084 RepID=A0A067PC34_9AGAM|nr:hypothetical protein JAAARDRAFT_73684 [Jaapia argillacea MUCL 33604]
MRTVKVVVMGCSGVGKTSLRGQYISGRFSTAYRATIGADFISKTLPHYNNSEDSVTLQIWDTAGQERFSSLSTAFFRGADAAILMFDVNQPQTLEALIKWWTEFKDKAPLLDEEAEDYCCIIVGNKVDLADGSMPAVLEMDALRFVDKLIPPSLVQSAPPDEVYVDDYDSAPTVYGIPAIFQNGYTVPPSTPPRTTSIDIHNTHGSPMNTLTRRSKSRSRSRSKFLSGTVTTTHTTLSIYHTPSSSIFDMYESARSSPTPGSPSSTGRVTRSVSPSPTRSTETRRRNRSSLRRLSSLSMSTTSTAPTITPSLFYRHQAGPHTNQDSPPTTLQLPPLPPSPERRPKLFFTSAKTGEGVKDVFEYLAKRVVMKWEYEEAVDARVMHYQEASGLGSTSVIRLDDVTGRRKTAGRLGSCCSS